MPRISAETLIHDLVDDGTWLPTAQSSVPHSGESDPTYALELRAAAEQVGVDESITYGRAQVSGHDVVIVASQFEFLAGSMGQEAARRIVRAFDEATELGLPVIGLPTSGGIRMQEGTPTFLLMAGIAASVRRHRDAGLPYLVYLRNPTTGGVFASWASLGDVTFGEPGALTGFLGPRVYEGLYGRKFPEGVQTSEGLARVGVIDGAADPAEFRYAVAGVLRIWSRRSRSIGARDVGDRMSQVGEGMNVEAQASWTSPDAWECILRTRQIDRPGAADLLSQADRVVHLSGDQAGSRAGATGLALVEAEGIGLVCVAQDRAAQAAGDAVGPADLRVARRGMRLAEAWGLPLVTVVDTQGGELSAEAEQGALAGEIARCLSDLSALKTVTVSVLLGGGAGGVALALMPTDRVLAVADAWVTPLQAEGASLIRHRTVDRADEMARSQSITAQALSEAGVVDRLLPELSDLAGPSIEETLALVCQEIRGVVAAEPDSSARAARWFNLPRS